MRKITIRFLWTSWPWISHLATITFFWKSLDFMSYKIWSLKAYSYLKYGRVSCRVLAFVLQVTLWFCTMCNDQSISYLWQLHTPASYTSSPFFCHLVSISKSTKEKFKVRMLMVLEMKILERHTHTKQYLKSDIYKTLGIHFISKCLLFIKKLDINRLIPLLNQNY